MHSDTDLSGLWFGWYAYPDWDEKIEFTAWIQESAGSLTGTTLEPNTFAAPDLGELSAEITGSRQGASVLFEKRYLPVPGGHDYPIIYSGMLNEDCDRMAGHWVLEDISGQFELSRLRSSAQIISIADALSLDQSNDLN